jgi:glycerol-3-phosphate dehydrogenase (NAD+)
VTAVKDANLLIFVTPHQFIGRICDTISGSLYPKAEGISLVKGFDLNEKDSDQYQVDHIDFVSMEISRKLSIPISVLMGANLALDIAKEHFSEAAIGYNRADENAIIWKHIFQTSYFRIKLVPDIISVELYGGLKNIVALAAGFVDGLYPPAFVNNTKAAIIRRGLVEMQRFREFFQLKTGLCEQADVIWESCGLADVITSSFGGRNKRIAEEFARRQSENPSDHFTIEELENEILKGQKLQGPATCKYIYHWLAARQAEAHFPLFITVYKICYEQFPVSEFFCSIITDDDSL